MPSSARSPSSTQKPTFAHSSCAQCPLRELCLPHGLAATEIQQLDLAISHHRRLKRYESLYQSGDRFEAIYAIRNGSFKTDIVLADGRHQVTGFRMTGELLGLDGISIESHRCNAVALEDSEVCVIPFPQFETLSRNIHRLQRHFFKAMSREIVRDHGVMMLLGTMRAEERLAAFLLNLSQRFSLRGYSANEFHLRMTRDEIGSFLGLKLETVSRTLSHFQELGLIRVQQKHVLIHSTAELKKLLSQRMNRL